MKKLPEKTEKNRMRWVILFSGMCGKKKTAAANCRLTGPLICSVFYSVSNKSGYCFVHTIMELFSENIFLLKILKQLF